MRLASTAVHLVTERRGSGVRYQNSDSYWPARRRAICENVQPERRQAIFLCCVAFLAIDKRSPENERTAQDDKFKDTEF